jgi:hypothetical protein
VYVLLPTPPIALPAASLGPVVKPCDIGGWSLSGFTPGAKRTRLMGMFENIGKALTSLESKFAPDVTDVVSRIGASAVTTIDSVIWPTSSVNARVTCWGHGERNSGPGGGLESRHLHRDVVRAGLQQRRFEVPPPRWSSPEWIPWCQRS